MAQMAQRETVEEPEAESDDSAPLFTPIVPMSIKPFYPEKELQEEIQDEPVENIPKPAKSTPPKAKLEPGYENVILQGLNKVTARASRLNVATNNHIRFGTLDIMPRSCWRTPPGIAQESAVLLDIYEIKPSEQPQKIFQGWLFSSSPSLSSLQHPFYDMELVRCDKKTEARK